MASGLAEDPIRTNPIRSVPIRSDPTPSGLISVFKLEFSVRAFRNLFHDRREAEIGFHNRL